MNTTYQLVTSNATEQMFRGAIFGIPPLKEQDRRFCELIDRLHEVSEAVENLKPYNALGKSMQWGLQQMIQATTANVMNTRLLKNERDVFRTLNEMEKRTARFERIVGIQGWKELYA